MNIRNKSGHTGISKHQGDWIANISIKGRQKYLGSFVKLEDAIKARKNAERAKLS